MIGPLPHTGPMPPEGRGDSADQQHGQAPSDLFAQLLGAGGALAAEQAALAEAPSMPAPEASLLVPDVVGADPAQQAPAPLARVFNQDGFFGHAGKIPGQAVMLEREEAALAQAPGVAPAGLAAALRPEVAFPAIPGAAPWRDRARGMGRRCASPGQGRRPSSPSRRAAWRPRRRRPQRMRRPIPSRPCGTAPIARQAPRVRRCMWRCTRSRAVCRSRRASRDWTKRNVISCATKSPRCSAAMGFPPPESRSMPCRHGRVNDDRANRASRRR